jgi:molecular chaperone DnaK
MVPSGTWVLAVDFGNTNTVAAVGDNNGVRTLTMDGRTIMPSAVLLIQDKLGQGDRWLVGDSAINMAPQRLERFERTPKHRIGEESLLMGDRFVPVVEAVAAVLRVLVDEAVRQREPRPPARFVVNSLVALP